jgi:hypothetical protein
MKRSLCASAAAFALTLLTSVGPAAAQTAATYVTGRISNVTFAGNEVLIMVDAGLPNNCVGTGWGWMRIPPESTPMIAFVIGLWMRGDAAQTQLTGYTGGLVNGYCRIDQIDPVG